LYQHAIKNRGAKVKENNGSELLIENLKFQIINGMEVGSTVFLIMN